MAFTYSDDKLSAQTNADGTGLAYEYDSTGNLTALTYKGGKTPSHTLAKRRIAASPP